MTFTYSYLPSTGGGRSPILAQIQLGGGGTRTYQFGLAGHVRLCGGQALITGADEWFASIGTMGSQTPRPGIMAFGAGLSDSTLEGAVKGV